MVVNDLHLRGPARTPDETDPILVVDPNTVLAAPVALQQFKSISWRNTEIIQFLGSIEHSEFSHRGSLEVYKSSNSFPAKKTFGISALKGIDRHSMYSNA